MSSVSTSNIGFGGISTGSNGQTQLSGTLFGVDINDLIDSLVQAKSIPNIQREVKITSNTAKLSAYSELESKLKALESAAATLRNPRVTTGTADAFDAKRTQSRASGTIQASDLYGVTAANGTANGTYSITINRIARADTISGSGTPVIADATTATPLSVSGNLVLEGTNIAVTNTMTLTQIRDAINNASATTKVKASIVQATTGDVRLVLKHTQTGNAIALADDQSGTLLTDLGLAASGATDTSLSAELVLDGITAIRATNSVNDLITGVSIELFQADAGKPITLTIDDDLEGISESVASFITAYNEVASFVQAQRATNSEGTVGEDQLLYNDGLMQSAYRSLQSVIGSGASGVPSGALKSLRDIGIDLDQNGKLNVSDNSRFEDALLTNLDEVRALFGFSSSASTGFDVVNRPDNVRSEIMGREVIVRVTATDGSGVPTAAEFEIDGIVTAATIENGFIKGPTGSYYEGFALGYSGGVVSGPPYTGTFTPTQGIADQIAAALEPVLNASTGSLKAAKDVLTATNTQIETQITTLTDQLDIYRARLTLQFQAAQQAIQAFESQKNSILSFADSLNGN